MSFELHLAPARSTVSVLEAPQLSIRFCNNGSEPVIAPTSQDISGALCVETRVGQRVARLASGLTHQRMMLGGRIDARPDWEEIPPGGSWVRDLDLGAHQYSPSPGRYSLQALLTLESGAVIASNEVELEVLPASVLTARALRDNPVLDGLGVLLECAGSQAPYVFRQYNTSRPLAPWYGRALPIASTNRPVLAQASYFDARSFDHFFVRWFLFEDEGKVTALPLQWGKPGAPTRLGELPPNCRLLSSALDRGSGVLECFALRSDGALVCFDFSASGLGMHWELELPPAAASSAALLVHADGAGYQVVFENAGLHRIRIEADGRPLPPDHSFGSDLQIALLSFDGTSRQLLAAFWDGPRGNHLQLLALEANEAAPRVWYQQRPDEFAHIRELALDRDPQGLFHLLANADEGLFYQRQGRAPELVRKGAAWRAPLVTAQPAPYFGFFEPELGYNFYEYRAGKALTDDGEQ